MIVSTAVTLFIPILQIGESFGSHRVLGCRESLREVLRPLPYTKVAVLTLVHHFLSLCYPYVVLLRLLFFVLLFHHVL